MVILYKIILKQLSVTSITSSRLLTSPIHHTIGMSGNGQESSGVIMPHIYPIPCNTPIGNILQRRRVISHCLITYLLHVKVFRDKVQGRRVYLNSFFTHLLCFKAVRDWMKCCRNGTHYLVAHFHGFKMI